MTNEERWQRLPVAGVSGRTEEAFVRGADDVHGAMIEPAVLDVLVHDEGDCHAPVEIVRPQLSPADLRTRPLETFRESQRAVDLGAAEIIVSVGRGIKEADNIPVVQKLADVLGAELAASRPICDSGWLPMERQVGSSGQTVAPKMYLAVGISGAIQHLVGMKGSKIIVAINKDANAPIFEVADYGIVGDLFQVVPALVEEIRKAKG